MPSSHLNSSGNPQSSSQLASDVLSMEQTLQKLRSEMQKDREKRRDLVGRKGAVWGQAGRIRNEKKERIGIGSAETTLGRPRSSASSSRRRKTTASGVALSRTGSATLKGSGASTNRRNRVSSGKRTAAAATATSKRSTSSENDNGSLHQEPDFALDDFIKVRSTTTGNTVPQQKKVSKRNDSAGAKTSIAHRRATATHKMEASHTTTRRLSATRRQSAMGGSSVATTAKTRTINPSSDRSDDQYYNGDTTPDTHSDTLKSDIGVRYIQSSSRVDVYPDDTPQESRVQQPEKTSTTTTSSSFATTTRELRPQSSQQRNLSNTLFSGTFDTARGAAENSYALDYTNDDFQEDPGVYEELARPASQPQSLLEGNYDERVNTQDFQDAVMAWRRANGQASSQQKLAKVSSGTQSTTADGGSLLEGDYDERANAMAFQEAVMAWRQGVTKQVEGNSNTVQNPNSPSTTLRNGEVSIRGMRRQQNPKSSSSTGTETGMGTTTSGTAPQGNGSLLDGTYDESANQQAFQDAVMSWRRKNLPEHQLKTQTSESSIGSNKPLSRNPKVMSASFSENLVKSLYPTYF
eukprot:CAMPEP_0117445700 /NCGR_PEP_ID=MMETSP0759-20121206/5938_1 /TAXON_ID=63605 /ORGANISM="Percolomonas cosmopolitus, Strain WS" /LENGTH=577 /DNA_ID=CAMNT_0005237899 /DNA_START=175 /DNA_END=1905 /DNA_ORIENTATION=-